MDNLIIYSLAVWYVAYAVTSTHGPYGVFSILRNFAGGRWHGRTRLLKELHIGDPKSNKYEIQYDGLLDCPVCLALWVAILFSLLPFGILISALAIAGGAMILHGIANWRFGNE